MTSMVAGNEPVKCFRNREDAAFCLSDLLLHYRNQNPLILAVPNGAIPIAALLARDLGGQLDVMLVHKIPAPGQPDLALGAVNEGGEYFPNAEVNTQALPQGYLAGAITAEKSKLLYLRRLYSRLRKAPSLAGRVVIVADDGIATGSTMVAALKTARAAKPQRLVAAAGVVSPRAIALVQGLADEVAAVMIPPDFENVAKYYLDFRDVTDKEVAGYLANHLSQQQ
jgi:predicted phosphoribosyltransferase